VLFPLRVEHFHEKSLGRRAAAAVLMVQMFFASAGQRVNLWHDLLQLGEFVLQNKKRVNYYESMKYERHY